MSSPRRHPVVRLAAVLLTAATTVGVGVGIGVGVVVGGLGGGGHEVGPGVTLRAQSATPRTGGTLRGRVDVRRLPAPAARRPTVTELGTPASRDLPDLRRAVVYLETAPRGAFEEREPARIRLDQRNETFVPHVLAIQAGTVVDFPNNDRIFHNVFSLSKARRFDLGRYPQGHSKGVRFNQPGVVRVFCDIHSHMSAFVLVFGHRFFASTDADGSYRIDGIPAGTYNIVAWHEGEARETRAVTIPDGGTAEADFTVQ